GVLQTQLGDDVRAHLRRCRRGVGVDVDRRKGVTQRAELAVLRAEVMAPLADAVRLVHREERGLRALKAFEETVHHQPLGREVEQLDTAAGYRAHHARAL